MTAYCMRLMIGERAREGKRGQERAREGGGERDMEGDETLILY